MVKKLWQGKYVSVRDYEVKQAIAKGGMRIEHGKDIMQLNVAELQQLKPTGATLQSKYGGTYRLVDITFKPLDRTPRSNEDVCIMGKRVVPPVGRFGGVGEIRKRLRGSQIIYDNRDGLATEMLGIAKAKDN